MTFAQKARYGAGVVLASGSLAAQAAAVDVSDLVTDIGAQVASIVLVGGAVLLVMIAVRAFKWVRAAMS